MRLGSLVCGLLISIIYFNNGFLISLTGSGNVVRQSIGVLPPLHATDKSLFRLFTLFELSRSFHEGRQYPKNGEFWSS
jgi:hypothetical protein